ncbi:MAG: MFS transporter [Phycisphaeraceae bacterium]|nr:MFS transporter [Phycisphaeraceae bacterium]
MSKLPAYAEAAHTPLWRNVSFALMWSSVAASGFGDRLIQLAAWKLLGMDLAEAQASSIQAGVYFFFFLPYLVFGPLGGWLADSLPRKWVLLGCDEVRGLLLLWAMVLVPPGVAVAIPGDHHWKVYSLIAAVGVFAAIFSPTRNATIPQIVPTRQLQAANAIVSGIAVVASMIGLLIGGWFVSKWSVKWGLVLGVILYMGSGTFWAFLRLRPHEALTRDTTPQWQRMARAVSFIGRHRPVLELVLLSVLFWVAANVFVGALAALSKNRYGIGNEQVAAAIAVLGGVTGFGMLTGSLALAALGTRRESAWTAMIAIGLCALTMLAMAVNSSFTVGLGLAFFTGFFGNAAMIVTATLTQSLAPVYICGRVFGVRELMTTFSAVVVNLVVWRMPDADAWMIPVLCATAGLMCVVAIYGLGRELRGGPLPTARTNALWHITRLYCLVWHRLKWEGRHHIPADGPVILAANHTTGIDGLVLQAPVPRLIRWVMLTKYLYRGANFVWKAIEPIDLEGSDSDRTQIRRIVQALGQGQIIGFFPEGRLQRENRVLGDFEPGIGLIVRRSEAVIVPAWIEGTPRAHGMIWHFLRPSRTTVKFGPAYRPDPGWSYEQIALDLRARMVELAGNGGVPVGI